MERRDFLKALSVLTAGAAAAGWVHAGDIRPGKILYFDLSTEWEHPPTVNEPDGTSFAAKIVKKLGEELGREVVISKDGSLFDGDLSAYAAFVFYTCGDLDHAPEGKIGFSEQGVKNFFAAIRSGTGFLGIHSATDTWQCAGELFENQREEDRTEYIKMIGGDFITHGEIQEAELRLTTPVQLPSLKALGSQTMRVTDEWYTMKNFNHDMHVLIVQETAGMKQEGRNACYNRPPYPSTWVRMEGKGRVAYTAFGHGNEMWEMPHVPAVVKDLMAFVIGEIDLDMTPNFDQVCPRGDVLPKL